MSSAFLTFFQDLILIVKFFYKVLSCRQYRDEVKFKLRRQTRSAVTIDKHVTKNFANWFKEHVRFNYFHVIVVNMSRVSD